MNDHIQEYFYFFMQKYRLRNTVAKMLRIFKNRHVSSSFSIIAVIIAIVIKDE